MKRATGHRVENVPYVPYVPWIGPKKAENRQPRGYIGHIGHIHRGRHGEKKTMDFDVADLFGNLFGGTVPTVAAMAIQREAVPEPIPHPEAAELPTPAVETKTAAVVGMPDFDSLSLPGDPCPRCGSLEEWADLLGGRHCGVCEADALGKALRLAELAAWLRQQAPPRKLAPKIAPHCVAVGSVDSLDPGDKRPLQSQPAGYDGA